MKRERKLYYKSYYNKNKKNISDKNKTKRDDNPEFAKECYSKYKEYYNKYSSVDKHKDRARDNKYKSLYKISLDDYNKILKDQNECCKICKKHQSEFKKVLAVDHDHKTGKVRGLLCDLHNRGLGMFQDNINLLEEAIEYLKLNSNDTNIKLLD